MKKALIKLKYEDSITWDCGSVMLRKSELKSTTALAMRTPSALSVLPIQNQHAATTDMIGSVTLAQHKLLFGKRRKFAVITFAVLAVVLVGLFGPFLFQLTHTLHVLILKDVWALLDGLFSSLSAGLFISAFLGFLSALVVEYITRWVDNQRERSRLIQEIKKELRDVLTTMEEVAKSPMSEYLSPYATPVWDGAYSSGAIASLKGYKCLNDISRIYWRIYTSNAWEKMKTELHFMYGSDPDKFKRIVSQISSNRNEVLKELRTILAVLEG